MFNNWRFWLSVGVSLFLLLILVYKVDLGEITTALADANYFYVVPAIGLYFVAVYFRAVRWRYLLSPLRSFSVSRLYPIVIIGYMANNLLPARLGELVRSYYLAQREQFNTSTALATVVVERVYDGLTLLAFAALAGPVLLVLSQFGKASDFFVTYAYVLAGFTVVVFLGVLGFLTLLAIAPDRVGGRLIAPLLRVVPARFRPKARELAVTFIQGLSILASPRRHLGLFLLSVPVWLLEGAVYFLVSYSFGIDSYFGSAWVLLLVIALLTATSNLATSLPTAIGGIGPFEVVAQQTLMALGVGASVAATYAGFLHLVALWLPVNLVGLGLMWKQNLSWRQLVKTRSAAVEAIASSPAVPPAKEGMEGYSSVPPRPTEGVR